MDVLVVEGGTRLQGSVPTLGAKNAVLPVMAAALLTDEALVIENVPGLADVRTMGSLLEALGAEVAHAPDERRVTVCVGGLPEPVAPWDLVRKMRASFEVLGPLVARCGRARVSHPGGCVFGVRPVDVHLKGLRALGARVSVEEGDVVVEAPPGGLVGAEVFLGVPSGSSVGATRNVLMAATLARGRTVIQSAAPEPEVTDLAHCLIAMGARIEGAGSPTLVIEGVDGLSGATHRVVPDRIEAGTYLIAGALTGGTVRVEDCRPEHLGSLLDAFWRAGIPLERGEDWVEVQPVDSRRGLTRPTDVATQPYPGFPTDLQAQWMALMALADGVSLITDHIYPDRYMHVAELLRLGANVRRQGSSAVVAGVERLSGANVMASDLRGSAALVMAGLVAEGTTEVHRVYHVDRGYERIEERLQALGANVRRTTDG